MLGVILVYLSTAVGILGSLYNPVIGLFVYVGFAMLRPQFMWSFAGNLGGMSQYVGIAMLVGWALKGFGGFKMGPGRTAAGVLLGFAAWAYGSANQGVSPVNANLWVIELAKVVAPFLVGVTMLNDRKYIRPMFWVIVGCHAYIALDMNNWYYVRGYNFVREQGYGYMDNNSFAISLVTVMGLVAGLLLSARRWYEKGIVALCAVLILSCIVLTYSRGALVGLCVVAGVAVVLIPKKPSYLAMMLLGALVAGRLVGPQVVARFATTFAEEEERDGSAQSRIDLWRACLQIGLENPLMGIGPRGFPAVASQYGFSAGKEAHSTWMQAIAEMGFVGCGLLMLFYLTTIFKLIPVVWKRWGPGMGEDGALATGVLIALSGFFVSAQFVTMIGLETPYYVAMVALAMLKFSALPAAAPVAVPARPVRFDERVFVPARLRQQAGPTGAAASRLR